eukprot:Nk52_evm17s327 gene=Nk52_evmTU17s327
MAAIERRPLEYSKESGNSSRLPQDHGTAAEKRLQESLTPSSGAAAAPPLASTTEGAGDAGHGSLLGERGRVYGKGVPAGDGAVNGKWSNGRVLRLSAYEEVLESMRMLTHSHATMGFYELYDTIGKGNFGKVKRAKHRLTGDEVAIKIVDKKKLVDDQISRLRTEISIMKLLNHPNIVRLYEIVETDTNMFLVMEHCAGGEIFDYVVAHGRLCEKDARRHFRALVSAMDYCHNLHVIHRDLKAENLLLDEHLNVKIADFGFGNIFSPGAKMNTFCGSPPYAAPELYKGLLYDGTAADVWSLGVVLFVLVCGSLPFDGDNIVELRAKILKGRFVIPCFMTPECENLIKKMLKVNPEQRISLAEVKKHPWMNFDLEPLPQENCAHPVTPPANLNDDVLFQMTELGISSEEAEQSLKENSFNSVASIYYLLLQRQKKFDSDNIDTSSINARKRNARVDKIIREKIRVLTSGCPIFDQYCSSLEQSMPTLANLGDEESPLSSACTSSSTRRRRGSKSKNVQQRRSTVGNSGSSAFKARASAFSTPGKISGSNSKRNHYSMPTTSHEHGMNNKCESPRKGRTVEYSRMFSSPIPPSLDSNSRPVTDEEKLLLTSRLEGAKEPSLKIEEIGILERAPSEIDLSAENVYFSDTEAYSTEVPDHDMLQLPLSASMPRGTCMKEEDFVPLKYNSPNIYQESPIASPRAFHTDKQQAPPASNGNSARLASRQGSSGDESIRSMRFAFNTAMVSTLDPETILWKVREVLDKDNILFQLSGYTVACVSDEIHFEIEICQLARLSMNSLRFRRISGDNFKYKALVDSVVSRLSL